MRVRDVMAAMDRLAPPGWALGRDKIGLSVGDPASEVSAVLVTLSVTRESYDAAREAGAELIVSHHPLIWEPLRSLRTDNPAIRLCVDIAGAGMACFSAHTNLDVAPGGVNTELAERLGLVDTRPMMAVAETGQVKLVAFVPESHLDRVREAVCEAGGGEIGDYRFCTFSTPGTGTFMPGAETRPFSGEKGRLNEEPEFRVETIGPKALLGGVLAALNEAHPYETPATDIVCLENTDSSIGLGVCGTLPAPVSLEDFARHVRAALGLSHVRVVGDLGRPVKRVAALGGSGGGEIERVPSDVDVYLTGDIGYHNAEAARERGLALVDAGHHGSERCIVPVVAEYLANALPSLAVVTYEARETFDVVSD